jgi:DNA-binding transcriptional LysR family regulator
MRLDDLHLAVVIADEGSLSAASARLGITPPTLSKAVARLERVTKSKLFERQARGMQPTQVGRAFLERARPIDLAAADLQAALRDLRQVRGGSLRWGVGLGVPERWVLPIAQTLVNDGVHLVLAGSTTDDLMRRVSIGDLELVLVGLSEAPEAPLTWLPLEPDPMQVAAPLAHPLLGQKRAPDWKQLAQARWVVPGRGTATFAEFESNFAAHGLQAPQPVVASYSSRRELDLAHALDALLLVPRSLVEAPAIQSRFATLVPQGGWASQRQLAVVLRAGAYLSPAAERTLRRLQEMARPAKPPRRSGR